MSIDLYSYAKSFENFSKEECITFFEKYGLKVEIHPEFEFETQSGFLPFKVIFEDENCSHRGKEFISGFEFSLDDEYDYKADLKELQPKGLFSCFNKRKYICDEQIDAALKESKYLVGMYFHEMMELVVAQIFSAYLSLSCGAVYYDPQADTYFLPEQLNADEEINSGLQALYADEFQEWHPFEGWL